MSTKFRVWEKWQGEVTFLGEMDMLQIGVAIAERLAKQVGVTFVFGEIP